MKKIFSSLWFKAIITISLLTFVFINVDMNTLFNEIRRESNYTLLCLALLVLVISHVFGSYTWMYIIHAKEKKVKKDDILSSYWKGLFFNLVLPTSMGGDIVKGMDIINQYKKSHFFISTILLDRIINLSFLMTVGVFAFCIYFQNWKSLILFGFGIAGLIIVIFFFGRALLYKTVTTFHKKNLRYNILRIVITLKHVLYRKNHILLVSCCAFISQFLKTIVTYIMAAGLGYQLSLIATFFIVPVQTLISLIPISINGIGLREFSNQIFEDVPNISPAELSIITLTSVVILILSTTPAIYFIFRTPNSNQ